MKARLFGIGLVTVVAATITCTDIDLIRNVDIDTPVFDNKLKLNGKFCTTDPADVVFPLKVLFMIDTSQSMNTSDPIRQDEPDPTLSTGRAKAIRDVISQYINIHSQATTTYCNTGQPNCQKGSTNCPACGTNHMCIGPDCCQLSLEQCKGVPICPTLPITNGTCVPLCDVNKAGCGPGEKGCPDCPDTGDECLNGICGNHKDPGVEFAVMRFGSAKQVITKNRDGVDGFTNDVKELVTTIPQVSNGGSVTDYEGALSMAYKLISKDIDQMKSQNATALHRTKYVVVFLSDGKPYPPINDGDDWDRIPDYLQNDLLDPAFRKGLQEYNIPQRILTRVKEIMGLKVLHNLGDIKIHTSYLAGAEPAWVEDESIYLLKQMSQIGKGTFRSFPNNESINFLHVGFSSLRRVFSLKNFLVSNINARPSSGEMKRDSDGDGIDDFEEEKYGSCIYLKDTDKDRFSDTLEHFFHSSGWDALDPADADCPLLNDFNGDNLPDDVDGDGLLDCEERFLGTNRLLFDSDADGTPDEIELKFGTNPVVADVENDNLDFDGMSNGDEIRLHTDPRKDDAAHRSRTSYRYQVKKTGSGIENIGIECIKPEDCPSQTSCSEGYCRCTDDNSCSSNAACETDVDCKVTGEICESKQCRGKWKCTEPIPDVEGKSKMCSATKHITCYQFEVENISLVTPIAGPNEEKDGWNNIYLYFVEAPFDNPMDYGNFQRSAYMPVQRLPIPKSTPISNISMM